MDIVDTSRWIIIELKRIYPGDSLARVLLFLIAEEYHPQSLYCTLYGIRTRSEKSGNHCLVIP